MKKLRLVRGGESLIEYTLKPQLRTLGPKYGKKLRAISDFLAHCDAREVVDAVRANGSYTVDLDGEVTLLEEDLQIFTSSAEGYAAAQGYGITVALDTALDEALLDEGCTRELVSRIQSLRKEAGFEVTDRIRIFASAEGGRLQKIIGRGAFLKEVLASELLPLEAGGAAKTIEINGESLSIRLEKL